MNLLFRYANPHQFMRLSGALLPACGIAAALCLAAGLYLAFSVPPDYQQGTTVTLLFIHVPADVVAELAYGAIAACSLLSLVWRHPLSDTAARAAAPLGALFTALGLITGALWGKPMWGTYWVWDARLTSELVLLLIYLGIIALWQAVEDPGRAARAVAILTLVGTVNLPIIKFSVDWWNTLHQGESIFRAGGPTIDSGMLTALFVMLAGMTLLFATLLIAAMRNEILRRRVRTLELTAAGQAA